MANATHEPLLFKTISYESNYQYQQARKISKGINNIANESDNGLLLETLEVQPILSNHHLETRVIPECEIRPTDIICGRERAIHSHPGNTWYKEMVKKHRLRYQSTTLRYEKSGITCSVMQAMQAREGRFLKRDPDTGEWHILNEDDSYEKISHALRTRQFRHRPRIGGQKSQNVESTCVEDEMFQLLCYYQERFFLDLIHKNENTMQNNSGISGNETIAADSL